MYSFLFTLFMCSFVVAFFYHKHKKHQAETIKRYNDFCEEMVMRYKIAVKSDEQDFKKLQILLNEVDHQIIRINLLSKENSKLREENELLREKLSNLGFSDVDFKL